MAPISPHLSRKLCLGMYTVFLFVHPYILPSVQANEMGVIWLFDCCPYMYVTTVTQLSTGQFNLSECFVTQFSFYVMDQVKKSRITWCAYKKSHNTHFIRMSICYVLVSGVVGDCVSYKHCLLTFLVWLLPLADIELWQSLGILYGKFITRFWYIIDLDIIK